MMKRIFFYFVFLIFLNRVTAQYIRIGEWNSHMNYTHAITSVEVKDKIYTATEYGLYYVNKNDESVTALSKTDGFNDISIKTIGYDKNADLLLIAYNNTYIDVLKGNTTYSIPDLYRKSVPGKKVINNLYFYGDYAYISTSFGVVIYDISKDEIRETYSEIGANGTQPDILNVCIMNDSIFAATKDGILTASMQSTNLMDYRSWSLINNANTTKLVTFSGALVAEMDGIIHLYKDGKWSILIDTVENTCVRLEVHGNRLFCVFEEAVYYYDLQFSQNIYKASGLLAALIDSEGSLWLTVKFYGLLKKTPAGYHFFNPNCPSSSASWSMAVSNNIVYVAPGGLTPQGSPTYNSDGLYYYRKGLWYNQNVMNNPSFNQLTDIVKLAVDPLSKNLFIGSYGHGLLEYKDDNIIKRYDQFNSSLEGTIDDSNLINIRGLCFDQQNRLWISNFGASNQISVRNPDNTWKSYYLGSGANRNVADLIIDDYNRKWILLPLDEGILVFDETITQGTNYRKLTKAEGNGSLPTERIHSIAKDLKGRIWVGSEEGVAVFYNPEDVFSGSMDAQRIWITEGEEAGYLLASEIITAIAVDGANNKWLGSHNGVWYVSDDGSKILLHFNKDNSPLPSGMIRDIVVNPENGEVFFATEMGIVSFRGNAIEGGDIHENVYAFPNPVEPGYEGPIAIRGLVSQANVKITDITGNVVTEMTAQGGQAVWDGKDISGNPVHSGVYLVFSTNDDGSETAIAKILIIR